MGVLGERDGWPEGDFCEDRGIDPRGTDGGAAEGEGGVLAWFEDFRPVIGAAYDEFETVGSRRVAGGHGARTDTRGFGSGHGCRRVGVDENRKAKSIAAPADAIVEDGKDLRRLSGARQDGPGRDDLGWGDAAAINITRVLPHGV